MLLNVDMFGDAVVEFRDPQYAALLLGSAGHPDKIKPSIRRRQTTMAKKDVAEKTVGKKMGKKEAKALAKETKRVAKVQKTIDKVDKRIAKLQSKKVKLEAKRDGVKSKAKK